MQMKICYINVTVNFQMDSYTLWLPLMGVRRGGQEGALDPPPLASQNSMFFDFFSRK